MLTTPSVPPLVPTAPFSNQFAPPSDPSNPGGMRLGITTGGQPSSSGASVTAASVEGGGDLAMMDDIDWVSLQTSRKKGGCGNPSPGKIPKR